MRLNSVIKKLSIPFYLFVLMLACIWIVYCQHGDMSNDGALYIKQAYFFSINDPISARAVYSWPFFSYLIAQTHLISGLSLINAAQALNIFLFLLACLYFLKVLQVISDDPDIVFCGFIIIITSIPLMDDYFSMMLRDNGAWAGFVAGSYYFIRWYKTSRMVDSLMWQLSFLTATLFRPEAFVLLLILPLAHFYIDRNSSRNFLRIGLNYSVLLTVSVLAILFLLYQHSGDKISTMNWGRLSELYYRPKNFLQNLTTPLPLEVHHPYLIKLVQDHQLSLKFGFLSFAIVYSWFFGLKIFHAFLAFTALWKKLLPPENQKPFFLLFIVTFLITTLYSLSAYETSGRYWMMNWWIVYVLSALGLHYWLFQIKSSQPNKTHWIRSILWFFILGHLITNLFDTSPKHPERYEAISWIKSHKIDPREIYSNDPRAPAMLLGKYEASPITLDEAIKKNYRYLLIKCSGNNVFIDGIPNYHLIASFPNGKNPKLAIYELNQ